MLRCVLFDLDGTLLPMAFEDFFGKYFHHIGQWMSGVIEPRKLVSAIWESAAKVAANDDERSYNIDVFYAEFGRLTGLDEAMFRAKFADYYANAFDELGAGVKNEPLAAEAVRLLKERGVDVVLATNPLFPENAIEARIRWAGLAPKDFALITHGENMTSAKPNPSYYREILRKTGRTAAECVMVGNDVLEDLCAESVGMRVFWLNTHGINKSGQIPTCPQGGYAQMYEYLRDLTKRA